MDCKSIFRYCSKSGGLALIHNHTEDINIFNNNNIGIHNLYRSLSINCPRGLRVNKNTIIV